MSNETEAFDVLAPNDTVKIVIIENKIIFSGTTIAHSKFEENQDWLFFIDNIIDNNSFLLFPASAISVYTSNHTAFDLLYYSFPYHRFTPYLMSVFNVDNTHSNSQICLII